MNAQGVALYTFRPRRSRHFAIGYGHLELIDLLLDHGADIQAKDDHGWTPLHIAVTKGNRPMVERLTAWGDVEQVQVWLDATLRMHGVQATPLHMAAYYGRTDIADLLLRNGAAVNVTEVKVTIPGQLLYRLGTHLIALGVRWQSVRIQQTAAGLRSR